MRHVTFPSVWAVVATVLISTGLLIGAFSSACLADTGVLKLKVRQCVGTNWISGAEVDVSIYRPGVGQVDSATGYTSATGYVQFSFSSLQSGDEAHVTVTPSGHKSDSGHLYVWDQDIASEFDVSMSTDSLCSDGWYDQSNHIILCVYTEP
jgi:hypothetical protein